MEAVQFLTLLVLYNIPNTLKVNKTELLLIHLNRDKLFSITRLYTVTINVVLRILFALHRNEAQKLSSRFSWTLKQYRH